MSRSFLRWNPALGLLMVLIAYPVYSQGTRNQADDRRDVEDVVRMIEQQGQLRLAGAIEIAERHTKGRAVRASVEISRERMERTDAENKNNPAPGAGDRKKDDRKDSGRKNDDNKREGEAKSGDSRAGSLADPTSGGAPGQSPAGSDTPLIYEVMCFSNGGIQAVRIDGRSRKVISDESRTSLDGSLDQRGSGSDDRDDRDDRGDDGDRDDDDDDDRDRKRDNRDDDDDDDRGRSNEDRDDKDDDDKEPSQPKKDKDDDKDDDKDPK